MMRRSFKGGLTSEYLYDADDERLGTWDESKWHWTIRDLSHNVVRELSSGRPNPATTIWNWESDHIYRGGQQLIASESPTGSCRFHLDHLGTPRLITDNLARLVSKHSYYPFGSELALSSSEQPEEHHKFTGHERDLVAGGNIDTLDYMHARFYAASSERLLSVDPAMNIDRAIRQPQNWNRYAYVLNSPLGYTDPDGREHVQEPGFTKPLSEARGWADQPSVRWAFYAQSALLSLAADEFVIGPAVGRALGAAGRVFGTIKEEISLSRNIMTALKSGDTATQLEGEAAAALSKTVTGFQKVVSQGGKAVGEIGVETSKAIVEVTSGQSPRKLGQITKLVGNKALNPSGKPVVVYGPNLGTQAAQALEKAGATVVRTLEQLKLVAQ